MGKNRLSVCSGFFFRKVEMINKDLLDILACPACKEKVLLDDQGKYLVCETCRVRYPIEDDIPVMLIDRAEKLD